MLTLKVDCSNHRKSGEPREEEFPLETIDSTVAERILTHLRQRGWVVQFNGEHMDTYCSKECAR